MKQFGVHIDPSRLCHTFHYGGPSFEACHFLYICLSSSIDNKKVFFLVVVALFSRRAREYSTMILQSPMCLLLQSKSESHHHRQQKQAVLAAFHYCYVIKNTNENSRTAHD